MWWYNGDHRQFVNNRRDLGFRRGIIDVVQVSNGIPFSSGLVGCCPAAVDNKLISDLRSPWHTDSALKAGRTFGQMTGP